MARVLIVDDDAETRNLWARIFALEGHETLLADDGVSALDAYAFAAPHLVVTDLQLSDLHGLEFIARLRAADPSVTIIAMSGDREGLETARNLGASITRLKPVDIADMLAVARQLLGKGRPT